MYRIYKIRTKIYSKCKICENFKEIHFWNWEILVLWFLAIFYSIIGPNVKSKGTLLLQIFTEFENFSFLFHFIIYCAPGRKGPICHFWCLPALPIRPKPSICKIRESKIDLALSIKLYCESPDLFKHHFWLLLVENCKSWQINHSVSGFVVFKFCF